MLMSFAKTAYLLYTKESCIIASFLSILLPNSEPYYWRSAVKEYTNEKWRRHTNRMNAESKGRKRKCRASQR
jgi:hypothetical protein